MSPAANAMILDPQQPEHWPFVSIIIPVLNEEAHIETCVQTIQDGAWPNTRMEILIVDGMSTDGTRAILRRLQHDMANLKMLDNPRRYAPDALNVGLDVAKGEIIIRMDAHAAYAKDYVMRCVERLLLSGADNVGGVCATKPGGQTAMAHAIALAMANPFGVGASQFRIGVTEPCLADTVPFGCWRRNVFDRIGRFDTNLIRNEDDEFNARLLKQGGRIILDPAIRASYFARPRIDQLARMMFQYGYFKPFVSFKTGSLTSLRQLVPLGFVITLIALAIPGFILWGWSSWVVAVGLICFHLIIGFGMALQSDHDQKISTILLMPLAFLTMHASYGWGFLCGLAKLMMTGQPTSDVSLSR